MLTLRAPLAHALSQHPERTAVIDGETVLDYRALVRRSRALGAALLGLGLQPGDRVALLAFNGHRYVEAFFGIPAAGLVVVPLNTRLSPIELRELIEDSDARALITDRDPGALGALVPHVLSIPDDYERLLEQSDGGEPTGPLHEDALAALFYTGGTTGRSKGVMLTHRNLIANALHKTIACSLTEDDRFLAAPAMFHVAGIAPLLSLIWLGGSIVTLPRFEPRACLELIARHRVTVFMPVPTMLAAVVDEQRRARRDVSSLRMLGHAGSSITNDAIEAAHQAFPDAELAQFYGATETASIVTCLRHEEQLIGTPRLGSCGRAVIGVQVRVVRPNGQPCEPQEVGEILVSGANVSVGYYGQPELSASDLAGGTYRSGDLGTLDDAGYLFVVDRKKDMIVTGGENVYCAEVEGALSRHPAVLEAAVYGVPDTTWGERVVAVVVVAAPPSHDLGGLEDELKAHCRKRIANYKVPKEIEVRREPLPKSGPGKVLKRVLRAERLAAASQET